VSEIVVEDADADKSPEDDPSEPVTFCLDNVFPPFAPTVQFIVFWFTPAVADAFCGACGTVVAVIFPETVFAGFASPEAFLGIIVNVYTPADSKPSKV